MINYFFMIDEHIVSIDFGSNSFNATCDFNIKNTFFKRKNIYELKCSI